MQIHHAELPGGVIMAQGRIIGLDFGSLPENVEVDLFPFECGWKIDRHHAREPVETFSIPMIVRKHQMHVLMIMAPGVPRPFIDEQWLIDHNLLSTSFATAWGQDGFVCVYQHALRNTISDLRACMAAGDFAFESRYYTRYEGQRARIYDAERIPAQLYKDWDTETRMAYS
jgi:hypothetical protein